MEDRRLDRMERTLAGLRGYVSSEAAVILTFLRQGRISKIDLSPWGSNYTFIAEVRHKEQEHLAIYKPRRGEIPLWDFPQGTLHRREFAAYLLSAALGWPLVPPTIIRGGPLGIGSLQWYVDCHPEHNYFTFGPEHVLQMQQIALFDCITNNADRKAGHCLLARDGSVWAIDHGLTFNTGPKLRTVIWEFAGSPVPPSLLQDLSALRQLFEPGSVLAHRFEHLLSPPEVSALRHRISLVQSQQRYPLPGKGRSVPWPPV